MGKLLIVSISDHEEHILNKIMEIIADEPELDHIALPPSEGADSVLQRSTCYSDSP